MSHRETSLAIATTDGTTLAGTLTTPASPEPTRPAALLLSGSGPLDRDSNSPGQPLNIANTLAHNLADLGVSTLRYDKRGVGQSGGDYPSMGFDQETTDAADALNALRQGPGVDADRVGIVGHSVGSTIALRLAAQTNDVAFAVLLGCATSPGRDVMAWQTDRIARTFPGPYWLIGRRFARQQAASLAKLSGTEEVVIYIEGKPEPARWIRQYRAYEPLSALARVTCPVLAITGKKDIQVDHNELAVLQAFVSGPCTISAPTNLTHLLRTTARKPSILQYRRQMKQPVDPATLTAIGEWVCQQVAPTTR